MDDKVKALAQVIADSFFAMEAGESWEAGGYTRPGSNGGHMQLAQDIIEAGYAPSSPPADDVREALAAEAWAAYQLEHGYSTVGVVPDVGADFWAGFERGYEVRPHGTVTDAEALAKAWDEGFELATRNNPNQPHPMAKLNPYRGEALS